MAAFSLLSLPPMLSIAFIRENRDLVIAGLEKKNFANAASKVDSLLAADQTRRALQQESDTATAAANQAAKQVGELMKAKQVQEAEALRQATSLAKAEIKAKQDKAAEAEATCYEILIQLPNLPHSSVPAGKTPDDNLTVKEGGTIPTLFDGALPHWDIIKNLGMIDFELGNKIAGAGFPVYRGLGARVQRKLINFFLDAAIAAGYEEVQPPILVNQASAYATGQLPDKDGQMYHDAADDLYLIPTAEVPITNIFRDVILDAKQIPALLAGYTPCFRREAGSWGAHVRGLNRLHQFDKVEIVQVQLPENSYAAQEAMCLHVESLLNALELPWRKLLLCGGDMSFASARTYDYEVWSAAQARWLEVSSVSNFETFQASRLMLRYRPEDKKTALLHTLNGSAMALPRVLAALLENNQQPDGSIKWPAALQPLASR